MFLFYLFDTPTKMSSVLAQLDDVIASSCAAILLASLR